MEQIAGVVEDIKGPFKNNWCILRISGQSDMSITGCMPSGIQIGDYYEFQGKRQVHSKYGEQFAALKVLLSQPKDVVGIRKYLDRCFRGIGEKRAMELVTRFGDELFSIMETDPNRLTEIRGISSRIASELAEQYKSIRARQEQDVFFAANGITPALMARLKERYGKDGYGQKLPDYKIEENIIHILKTNPYQVADEVNGIGFKKADKIAMTVGIPKDSPYRLEAGLIWTLSEASGQGHVYLPLDKMTLSAAKLLDVDGEKIEEAIQRAIRCFQIIEDRKKIYAIELHGAEKKVSHRLLDLIGSPVNKIMVHVPAGSTLDAEQKKSVELVAQNRVVILTGGPGSGKTHTLKTIITAFKDAFSFSTKIALCAPTGKAARRMSDQTGMKAKTIHRLLKYSPMEGGFMKNEEEQLDHDLIVVDEASMVDIMLMNHLLRAVPDHSRLLLVGDMDQLPSVGPGRVLNDLIESGAVPTIQLKGQYRTEEGSEIARIARLVNSGTQVSLDPDKAVTTFGDAAKGRHDFVFHRAEDKEVIPELILRYVERIGGCGKYSLHDIQILCPQKKGVIGTFEMNNFLRDRIFNPDGRKIKDTFFRIGDRVIQTRNNYDLGVFNGDSGIIEKEYDSDHLTINFSGMRVIYPLFKTNDIQLGYALTIHKSQGSEYPVVIMPIHTTNTIMLKRQLFYTGLTRGREVVVVIGNDKGVYRAIKVPDGSVRYSGLRDRMRR